MKEHYHKYKLDIKIMNNINHGKDKITNNKNSKTKNITRDDTTVLAKAKKVIGDHKTVAFKTKYKPEIKITDDPNHEKTNASNNKINRAKPKLSWLSTTSGSTKPPRPTMKLKGKMWGEKKFKTKYQFRKSQSWSKYQKSQPGSKP